MLQTVNEGMSPSTLVNQVNNNLIEEIMELQEENLRLQEDKSKMVSQDLLEKWKLTVKFYSDRIKTLENRLKDLDPAFVANLQND